MRFANRLLAASCLVAGLFALPALAEPVSIKLLQLNDWYRYLDDEGRGGFARLVTILADEDAAADNVLLVHAGDAFSPSLLSGFDQGAHMVALLNELPLDLFGIELSKVVEIIANAPVRVGGPADRPAAGRVVAPPAIAPGWPLRGLLGAIRSGPLSIGFGSIRVGGSFCTCFEALPISIRLGGGGSFCTCFEAVPISSGFSRCPRAALSRRFLWLTSSLFSKVPRQSAKAAGA